MGMSITRTIYRKSREPIRIDFWNPEAVAVCDGCGVWINASSRVKHMQYRGGTVPQWDGMMVCAVCDDVPNPAPQFSRLTLAPDPVPIQYPRFESPQIAYTGYAYWVDDSGDYVNTLSSDDTWGGEFVQTTSDW